MVSSHEHFNDQIELSLFAALTPQPSQYFIESMCLIAPLEKELSVLSRDKTWKIPVGQALLLPGRVSHEYVDKAVLPARLFAQCMLRGGVEKPELIELDSDLIEEGLKALTSQAIVSEKLLKLIASRIDSLFRTRLS